jgi:uncharacterized protein YjeT (DUF2065 family)
VIGDILWVVAGVLWLEALLPLLAPALWKRVVGTCLDWPDSTMRLFGAVLAGAGAICVLLSPPLVWAVVGGVMLFEGLPPALAPTSWQRGVRVAVTLRDGQIRFFGLLGVLVGCVAVASAGLG